MSGYQEYKRIAEALRHDCKSHVEARELALFVDIDQRQTDAIEMMQIAAMGHRDE